ncbi:MAG: M23 family metallopeptidase [Polyangiaceae bacterium]
MIDNVHRNRPTLPVGARLLVLCCVPLLASCATGGTPASTGSNSKEGGQDASQGGTQADAGAPDAWSGWPGADPGGSGGDAGSGTSAAGGTGGTSSSGGTSGAVGGGGAAGNNGGTCVAPGAACSPNGESCCGDLSCGATTAGQVCCGGDGSSCATPDGADCCGDSLVCVGGSCGSPGARRPTFSAPFSCGERWTYSHHAGEVRLALDFVKADGGTTNGAPVLASAPGVASRHFEAGGAGNYIVVSHGDGWVTYYFHLSTFSVPDNAWVSRGQEVGKVGSTGASSGPHLHYEQLHNGSGQTIFIEGASLAPYPGGYFSKDLVSENGCGTAGRSFSTWGSNRPIYASPSVSSSRLGEIASPTSVFIDCQTQSESVTAEGYTNDWWSHLRDYGGYLSNIYINDPASKLPGIPECP